MEVLLFLILLAFLARVARQERRRHPASLQEVSLLQNLPPLEVSLQRRLVWPKRPSRDETPCQGC